MSTTKDYLNFVLEQLADLGDVSARPMMGEYVLYYAGKVVGGIYDDRLLVKPTPSALQLLRENGKEIFYDIPYPGAKELLVPDVDDRDLSCRLIRAIAADLPAPKPKKTFRKS